MIGLAEIDGADVRVGADFTRAPGGEDRATHHHRDPLGEPEHQIHVVVDDEHADVPRQAVDRLKDDVALGARDPGRRLDADGTTNVRVIQHDAVEVLTQMLAPSSFEGVHIFFPDPWPKKRHHKRRLIQPPFMALLAQRMKPGAYLHVATDWEHYAEQILAVLCAEPLLANTAPAYAERPDRRPLTKFETRGLKLGHRVWDIVFRRR